MHSKAVFSQISALNLVPTRSCITPLIYSTDNVDIVCELMRIMKQNNIIPNEKLYKVCIAKCREESPRSLLAAAFKKSSEEFKHTYSRLLTEYDRIQVHLYAIDAVSRSKYHTCLLVQQFLRCKPDVRIFISLFKSCLKLGLYQQCIKILKHESLNIEKVFVDIRDCDIPLHYIREILNTMERKSQLNEKRRIMFCKLYTNTNDPIALHRVADVGKRSKKLSTIYARCLMNLGLHQECKKVLDAMDGDLTKVFQRLDADVLRVLFLRAGNKNDIEKGISNGTGVGLPIAAAFATSYCQIVDSVKSGRDVEEALELLRDVSSN